MPGFVDTAVKDIDDRLRTLKDEKSRLEAARAALTYGGRGRGRPASNGRTRTSPASRRNGRSAARARRGGNTRASQVLEIVRAQPGITIPDIAQAMKIQPNYLYRVLPGLVSAGEVRRDGQGWHPATSSTSTSTAPAQRATSRRRARAAKPGAKAATRTARRRRSAQATNGRTARGATRTAVLAAFTDGETFTAGQVAETTGLGRGTVSTTLSRLAKSGEVQKAERGYRRAPAA